MNSGDLKNEGLNHEEVDLVQQVREELEEIEVSDISEHSARFEALHEKLQESLKSIDNL
jgi:hypothetical protein